MEKQKGLLSFVVVNVVMVMILVGRTAQGWSSCDPEWFDDDYTLMTTDDGWWEASSSDGITVDEHTTNYTSYNIFRFTIPTLNATSDVVLDVFDLGILNYSVAWTPQFASGELIYQNYTNFTEDPEAINTSIIYMQFSSPSSVATRRDVCAIMCTKSLGDDSGVYLASWRSVSDCPAHSDFIRLIWRGANLITPNEDGGTCSLTLLDQENPQGWMSSCLMNFLLPYYLVQEYKDVVTTFSDGGVHVMQFHNKI